MVDEYGRPTFNDWMGIANSVRSLVGMNKDIQDMQTNSATSEYLSALEKDKNFDASKIEGHDGRAWAAAQKIHGEIENQKMDLNVKRYNATMLALQRQTAQATVEINSTKSPDGKVIESKRGQYNKALENLIKPNYNIINNGFKIVDFNHSNSTMRVVNEITGEIHKEPIPQESAVRNIIGTYFEFKGDVPGISKEGANKFFKYMTYNDEKWRQDNLEARKNATVFTNGKGRRILSFNQYDYIGARGGGVKTVYAEPGTGNEWEGEEGQKYLEDNGFKSYEEQKTVAGIDKAKSEAEYNRSGLKGLTPRQKEIKKIAEKNGVSWDEAEQEYESKFLKKYADKENYKRYLEELEYPPYDENTPEYTEWVKGLRKKHSLTEFFAQKEKIKVTDSKGNQIENTKKVTKGKTFKGPDGKSYKKVSATVLESTDGSVRYEKNKEGKWKRVASEKTTEEPRGISNMPF